MLPLVRFLSTQANFLLGMCSYTVREARSATGATPDAFAVGADAAGRVALANCAGAHLVIPNSAETSPEYCGAFLVNEDSEATASPVTGKIIKLEYLPQLLDNEYSYLSNKRVGYNKRVG